MKLFVVPPGFDGVIAEEESAEESECEGEDGDIDKIVDDRVAMDSVERQLGVHGHVENVGSEYTGYHTDRSGDDTLCEEEQRATFVDSLDIEWHGEP